VAALAAGAAGCEAPARSKPWRHAPEPSADQVPSTIGDILSREKGRMDAMAARGDTFSVWLDAEPRTLVPLVDPTEWTVRIAMDSVFEALVRYRPGTGEADPGGIEPVLAQSWRVLDGGRALAIELRPDVRFHDGTSMSSVDVQFSLDAARSPRTGAGELRRALASVSAVELAGPRAVRIYFHRPDATVLRALADVPILPARVYERKLRGGPGAPVVGTGPYRVEPGQGKDVRLVRWDDYWGAAPAIERVAFRFEGDAARALGLLRGGELDMVAELIPEHAPEHVRAPGGAIELDTVRLRPPALRYLVLNTRGAPFDDARMRCAIDRWIDREALVAARRGQARAVAGPVWPGGPADGPERPVTPPDRAAAARLLDEAGWRAGDDGVRQRGGRRLLVTVLVSDREDRARDLVLEQLRAAGFVLDTRVGSTAVLDNRLREGRFDLAFVEWRGPAGSDLSPLLRSGGAMNAGGFHDARVDAIFDELREAWDPAARWRATGRLGELVAETCPIIPLTAPDPLGLVSRRVRGATPRGGWIPLRALSLAAPQ